MLNITKHGVRKSEMEAAIFSLGKEVNKKSTDVAPMTLAFTIHGEHDELTDINGDPDEDGYPLLYSQQDNEGKVTASHTLPLSFAKVIIGKKTRYFVKTNSAGKFYNPMGMYSENRHNKQIKHIGKGEWEYREVSEKVCRFYLSFLKSRNVAWLINAEREAI